VLKASPKPNPEKDSGRESRAKLGARQGAWSPRLRRDEKRAARTEMEQHKSCPHLAGCDAPYLPGNVTGKAPETFGAGFFEKITKPEVPSRVFRLISTSFDQKTLGGATERRVDQFVPLLWSLVVCLGCRAINMPLLWS
jgi:hypothetical protein